MKLPYSYNFSNIFCQTFEDRLWDRPLIWHFYMVFFLPTSNLFQAVILICVNKKIFLIGGIFLHLNNTKKHSVTPNNQRSTLLAFSLQIFIFFLIYAFLQCAIP